MYLRFHTKTQDTHNLCFEQNKKHITIFHLKIRHFYSLKALMLCLNFDLPIMTRFFLGIFENMSIFKFASILGQKAGRVLYSANI